MEWKTRRDVSARALVLALAGGGFFVGCAEGVDPVLTMPPDQPCTGSGLPSDFKRCLPPEGIPIPSDCKDPALSLSGMPFFTNNPTGTQESVAAVAHAPNGAQVFVAT